MKNTKRKLFSAIIILSLITVFSCHRETPVEKELRERAHFFEQKRKNPPSFENTYPGVDEAITGFMVAIAEKKEPIPLCTKEEYMGLLLPYYSKKTTMVPNNTPETIWHTQQVKGGIAMGALKATLGGRKVQIKKIEKGEIRESGPVRFHFIKRIGTLLNGMPQVFDEIRIILEYKNRFKVCVINTG